MSKKSVLILLIALATLFLVPALYAQDNPLGWVISKTTLDNGLKVVVLEDHSTPSVSFQVWYHVGSKNERPGITGISHMFEHTMFKGSKNVKSEEHARIINAKGGMSNAGTNFDFTMYEDELGAADLETAVWLEAERLQNLNINKENLESERQVVAEERRMSLDNSPFGPVSELLFCSAYNAFPYGWMIVGWMSDIQHYTVADLRKYFDTYYIPNNATAVIVGDVNTADAIKLVKKYFGKIKRGSEPPRPVTVEPPQLGERRSEVHKIAQLPGVFAGYKVVESGHPDMYPLRVLAKVLFDGESSRAYKRLVYDEQKCLFVGGDFLELENPGLFFVLGVMQGPDKKTTDAEAALYEEIEKFKTTPLSQEDLQKALNQLESEKWLQLQSNAQKASAIGDYETIRGDYKAIFTEMDKYLAVTAEDVMRVAKKYLDSKNRTVVTLVPDMNAQSEDAGQ